MLGPIPNHFQSNPTVHQRLDAPAFQGAPEKAAAEAAVAAAERAVSTDIAHLGFAERIFKLFGKANADARQGGLSLEDMAARLLTVFGVYLPQGVMAVKNDQHKWETNGRNAIVWTMTLALTYLSKSDKLGFNKLLDRFMQEQKPAEQLTGAFDKLVNRFRMQADYFEILKAANIGYRESDRKNAYWSKLDVNKLQSVNYLYERLLGKTKTNATGAPGKLAKLQHELTEKMQAGTITEAEAKMLKALPGFITRLNVFPLITTSIITAATVYIIGDVAMRLVYKFVAPLDHDFVHPNQKKPAAPAQPKQLSITQPNLFQALKAQSATPAFKGGAHV